MYFSKTTFIESQFKYNRMNVTPFQVLAVHWVMLTGFTIIYRTQLSYLFRDDFNGDREDKI